MPPQIFDKALTEVTFTELYAELCVRLSAKLPAFEDPDAAPPEDGQPAKKSITFRRWAPLLISSSLLHIRCSLQYILPAYMKEVWCAVPPGIEPRADSKMQRQQTELDMQGHHLHSVQRCSKHFVTNAGCC
jgi:hypothetical protein